MLLLIFRMALLMLSLTGFAALLVEKLKLRIEFTPAVVCAGISSVMFIAGLLNFLPLAACVLQITGLLFFCCYSKKSVLKNKRNCFVLSVWIVVLVYFAILLKGSHFTHYDNFSHWAMVIKCMLVENRMPNFQDTVIMFQSYPLGSSLFIYYVCKTIGESDACYLFGQVLMSISFLLPLVGFIKKRQLFWGISVFFFSIFAITANILIYDLLVDTIMPLAGVSAFCIVANEYRSDDELRKSFYALVPMFVFLVNVKNSGVFFCIVCIIFSLIKNWHSLRSSKKLLHSFALLGAPPVGSIFLWKKHVAMVFTSGETTKHSMSAKNFSAVFAGKTPENIFQIGGDVLHRSFSWETPSFQILVCASLLLCLLAIQCIIRKKSIRRSILSLVGIWSIWVTYVIAVIGMYIFSMPLGEALKLASFSRYMSSVSVFILGIALIQILRYWDADHFLPLLLISGALLLPVLQVKSQLPTLYKKQNYQGSDRYVLQALIKDNDVECGKNIAFIAHLQIQGICAICADMNFGRPMSTSLQVIIFLCRKTLFKVSIT